MMFTFEQRKMRYTYSEQRIDAERELARRKKFYPGKVKAHRMSPQRLTREIETQQAIVDTLRELEAHERLL